MPPCLALRKRSLYRIRAYPRCLLRSAAPSYLPHCLYLMRFSSPSKAHSLKSSVPNSHPHRFSVTEKAIITYSFSLVYLIINQNFLFVNNIFLFFHFFIKPNTAEPLPLIIAAIQPSSISFFFASPISGQSSADTLSMALNIYFASSSSALLK